MLPLKKFRQHRDSTSSAPPSCATPTSEPTEPPTSVPTADPSGDPSGVPSGHPSSEPTCEPSAVPTSEPTEPPTSLPTSDPSGDPSGVPSGCPSSEPTCEPSATPTSEPTEPPTSVPTCDPSGDPSGVPSGHPSSGPIFLPTISPSFAPSTRPVVSRPTGPTALPSAGPTPLPLYFSTVKAYGGSRGDYVTAIAISASDWGSVLAGYDIGSNAAEYDGYVVKLDRCGEIVWSKSYGGPLVDSIQKVLESPVGSMVFVGQWTNPSSGRAGIMLGRLDPHSGDIIRVVSFSIDGKGSSGGRGVVLNDDGSLLVIGTSITSSHSVALVLLVEFSGSIIWSLALQGDAASQSYYFNDAARLVSGDYVMVGHGCVSSACVSIVSRVSANGERRHTSQWGVKGFDKAYSIARCRDGGYVIAAASRDYTPTDAIAVLRFDSKGRLMWAVSIDSSGHDTPSRIIVTHDDGYLVVGSTATNRFGFSKGCLVKLNSTGHMEWVRGYGNGGNYRDHIFDVVELPGGGYRAAGHGVSNRASVSSDAFMVQVTPGGDLRDTSLIEDMFDAFSRGDVAVVLSQVSYPLREVVGVSEDVTHRLTQAAKPMQRKQFTTSTCTLNSYMYSAWPTEQPTPAPTSSAPSQHPSSSLPTTTCPSEGPVSSHPTSSSPTTSIPSVQPTTAMPTSSLPTVTPSTPSSKPTPVPSILPGNPTPQPTAKPSSRPSRSPTHCPSCNPTAQPSARPTSNPTAHPTATPSVHSPTGNPTMSPTASPSVSPTRTPTPKPTRYPTASPTNHPSAVSTASPTTEAPSGGSTFDLHSVNPTSVPSANSRGHSSEEPELTSAELLLISVTGVFTFVYMVQIFAGWYMKDNDYSLIDMGIAAVAVFGRMSSRNRGLRPQQTVTFDGKDDLEAGGQVRFVEVQGSHWHSNTFVDGKAPQPTPRTNHDPHMFRQKLPDMSVVEEQALSASVDAVPEAASRSGAWERTLARSSQEGRLGALLLRGGEQGGGEECVRESQAPVTVTAGTAYYQEAFWSSADEDDRPDRTRAIAKNRKVSTDIPPTCEDIIVQAASTAGGVRGGGGQSWQNRADEEIRNGGILIPWDSDDSDKASSDDSDMTIGDDSNKASSDDSDMTIGDDSDKASSDGSDMINCDDSDTTSSDNSVDIRR